MAPETDVTLLDLLGALRRSWRWLLIGTLAVGILAGVVGSLLPPRYSSEIVLQINGEVERETPPVLEYRFSWLDVDLFLLPHPVQLPWVGWVKSYAVQRDGGFRFVLEEKRGILRIRSYGATPEEAQRKALEGYALLKERLRGKLKVFWDSYFKGEEMVLRQGLRDIREALGVLAQSDYDPTIRQRLRTTASLMELRLHQLKAYQEEQSLEALAEETLASGLFLLQPAQMPERPEERHPLRYGLVAALTFGLFGSLWVFSRELFRG